MKLGEEAELMLAQILYSVCEQGSQLKMMITCV